MDSPYDSPLQKNPSVTIKCLGIFLVTTDFKPLFVNHLIVIYILKVLSWNNLVNMSFRVEKHSNLRETVTKLYNPVTPQQKPIENCRCVFPKTFLSDSCQK